MFTGALAASYYGTPRTTMDIDIVIVAPENRTQDLADALREAGLRVDEEKFKQARRSGYSIVSLQDALTPYTVDLILSLEPLERDPCTILGLPTFVQAPVSLILAKLRMIKVTIDPAKSARDKQDVLSILRYTRVDMEELRERAGRENSLRILETLKENEETSRANPKKYASRGDPS